MLNKAREIMKQRESMIKEAQETLVVLGATNEATIVNNQIVINKGKIVEVPVVKEVVKYDIDITYEDSTTKTVEMDFDGYSIGGTALGEPKDVMHRMIEYTVKYLPEDKPRYLMGVGTPEDLLEGVMRGVDMFDCV